MKKQKNLKGEFHKCHVRKGDKVIVLSGDHKGKVGNIKEVTTKFIKGPKIKVEGVNLIKKKVKGEESKFKYIEVEGYIYASKVRKI